MTPDPAWLEATIGRKPRDPALYTRAFTHSSASEDNYERLEFLGDRVLGIAMATWLYELFPDEAEGKLVSRFNALVAGETCAEVARELGVPAQMILGKQARDDGVEDSDNVLGDTMESLLGAVYLEAGLEEAAALVRRAWGPLVSIRNKAPIHPKSALLEHAAAKGWPPPVYVIVRQSGPHHAPTFHIRAEVKGRGSAEAEGTSKREAETAAAKVLLKELT